MNLFEDAGGTILLAGGALWAGMVLIALVLAVFTNFWDVEAIPEARSAEQRRVDDLPEAA